MSTHAFGFRAYPRQAVLTPDQREYVAHMLQLQADRMVATLSGVGENTASLREWRGIVRACQRERERCAGLSRVQKAFAAEAAVRGAAPARRPT